jgi:hypothetical protein
MPVPEWRPDGYLPEGLHFATEAEVETAFGVLTLPVRLKSRQPRPEVRLRGLDLSRIQSAQADFGSWVVWF